MIGIYDQIKRQREKQTDKDTERERERGRERILELFGYNSGLTPLVAWLLVLCFDLNPVCTSPLHPFSLNLTSVSFFQPHNNGAFQDSGLLHQAVHQA